MLLSCTSSKNTGGTRWYHAFNTRYNIYFNGNTAYREAEKNQIEQFTATENYSDYLAFHPVSATPKDKNQTGGPFDKPIEKAVKAIKLHSIQTRPERDESKRNSLDYKAFIKRKEYNPFLHNAWMMMARSQFFNGDFLEAASTFSYISNLYEIQPEISIPAKIWKARCYNEIGWFYDAENILSKINAASLPKNQADLYSTVYADYLIKQKRYEESVHFLQTSIKAEKNKLQRNREKYLLGQIYASSGNKDIAYKTFGEVAGATVPYILQFNARIRQTEIFPGGDIRKITKSLQRMAKSSKNKEYLDMVYYALGNVYMTVPDTVKAVESYELGVEKSTRGGIDKALNQIQLGDIYFTRREYVKAQPNYSEALGQLKKEDAAYPRVSKRSEVLDALVIHVEAVELQDSLQRLSRMTEEERMKVVEKIIADLIKKEKDEQEKADMEEYQAQRQSIQSQRQSQSRQQAPVLGPPSDGSFYFYNPQAVASGKNAFQQKWGRRKLEDDWRRRSKSKAFDDLDETEEQPVDSLAEQPEGDDALLQDSIQSETPSDGNAELSEDPHDPKFYLQQIPVTEEDIEASNLIIQDGLYNMGVIYKDMLEDYSLALETLDTLNMRFPENETKLDAYHHIYLIYWKLDDMDMANIYKQKIRAEFPESELAIAMSDPDYEYNQKMMNAIQDSLYNQTFTAYEEGNLRQIRRNYKDFSEKYTQSVLMPKFMFLNALTYARPEETDTFKILLKQLIDKYPNEDVSLLAADMMKGFQRGLILASSGDNMLTRGSIFNLRFGASDDTVIDTTLVFVAEINTPHKLLLLYPKGSVNENMLLFNVAGFNFGNFQVNDFELTITESGNIGMLQIDGFNTMEQVMQYYDMIVGEGGYASRLEETIIIVPVSVANYETLMRGKSLEEYMNFFEEHFEGGNEDMIAKWRLKEEEEKATGTSEDKPSAETANSIDKATTFGKTDSPNLETDSIISLELPPVSYRQKDSAAVSRDTLSGAPDSTLEDVYSDVSGKVDAVTAKYNDIADDPIRGIIGLFKRKPRNAIDEYAAEQKRIEKEHKKQLAKESLENKKQELIRQRVEEKEREQQETAKQDSINAVKKQEKESAKLAEKAKKQAIENKKREKEARLKAKQEAAKQRKADAKARLKKREEERKATKRKK
jgi:tetratricopeptide (TPR) repeat protein